MDKQNAQEIETQQSNSNADSIGSNGGVTLPSPDYTLGSGGGSSGISNNNSDLDYQSALGYLMRDRNINGSSEITPSSYNGFFSPEQVRALWDIYKGLHWNSSYGRSSEEWLQIGLNRINGLLDSILEIEPGFDIERVEHDLYPYLHRPTENQLNTITENENNTLNAGRERQLNRGGENVEGNPEILERLNENIRRNGGISLAFTIPDAHQNKEEVLQQGGISNYARRVQTTRRTRNGQSTVGPAFETAARNTTYNNESVFMSESQRFASAHGTLGLFNNQLKMGIPNVYIEGDDILEKAIEIYHRISQVTGERHPISRIAIFSHGFSNKISGRRNSRAGDASMHRNSRRGFTTDTFISNLSSIMTDDVRVRLFACSTAKRADGGFADDMRDTLHENGHSQSLVLGHTTAGKATLNPNLRLFIGENNHLDLNPTTRENRQLIFTDAFMQSELSRLGLNSNSERTLKRKMQHFFRTRTWMMDFSGLDLETMTKEDFFELFRQSWTSEINSTNYESLPVA